MSSIIREDNGRFIRYKDVRYHVYYRHVRILPITEGLSSKVLQRRENASKELNKLCDQAELENRISNYGPCTSQKKFDNSNWFHRDLNGATICIIETEDREEVARGVSFCSVEDNFCKVVGRGKAFQRAYHKLVAELS